MSVKDADHVKWLSDKVAERYPNLCNEQHGIPLGWDFDMNNKYYSFGDHTREITPIFQQYVCRLYDPPSY